MTKERRGVARRLGHDDRSQTNRPTSLVSASHSSSFVCLVLRSERDVRKEPEDTEVNDERTERRAERQTDETSVTDAGSLRSFRSLTRSVLGYALSLARFAHHLLLSTA